MGSNDDQSDIDRLYEFGERLNEAKDKSTNVSDYKGIIEAAKGSQKAKQLAAQLIPRFYKYFPSLATEAMNAHFDLCEEEELGHGSKLFTAYFLHLRIRLRSMPVLQSNGVLMVSVL